MIQVIVKPPSSITTTEGLTAQFLGLNTGLPHLTTWWLCIQVCTEIPITENWLTLCHNISIDTKGFTYTSGCCGVEEFIHSSVKYSTFLSASRDWCETEKWTLTHSKAVVQREYNRIIRDSEFGSTIGFCSHICYAFSIILFFTVSLHVVWEHDSKQVTFLYYL